MENLSIFFFLILKLGFSGTAKKMVLGFFQRTLRTKILNFQREHCPIALLKKQWNF